MKRITSIIMTVAIIMLILPAQVHAAGTQISAGVVTTETSSLNVRKYASTSSPITSSLKKGTYITLLSKYGSWWKVEYARGQYGYCHADYITPVSSNAATVATQSSNLNVRSGAGISYTKVASLAKGENVVIIATSGSWNRILYHGTRTGYVSGQYLSSSTTGYDSVSLNVPSFKQTDSRWANVKIGTSGKTIAQIGCATTGIAMMESYRTGTTIYPDAMSKRLNYTASGSVYWPTNYVTVTSSSNYLSSIYQLLKQGKPVLLGAKNAYGSQHWVVITGFAGDTLTASGFSIHDPGSNSRTNLQQFLNAYPTFYKYFYY